MTKPRTIDAHDPALTEDCESVLVTLLSRLGPWRDSVYLVGGLTPRYIVDARPPDVPAHAGTSDVDVVVDMGILAETEAYATLEENLKKMGFGRVSTSEGKRFNWRWQIKTDRGNIIVLEFLSWDPTRKATAVQELPTAGEISAVNIPHSDIVFDHYEVREISAPLLGGDGNATVAVRHADQVALVCLKALALDHRNERKDAHDLVYCLEYADGGVDTAIARFKAALNGAHAVVVARALDIITKKFATDRHGEGYMKDGPTMAARFELGDATDPDTSETATLRQRDINALIEAFLAGIAA